MTPKKRKAAARQSNTDIIFTALVYELSDEDRPETERKLKRRLKARGQKRYSPARTAMICRLRD